MTNIIYMALIFVFALGAGMTYINDTGLYDQKMPDSGIQSNIEQANQTSLALQEEAQHPTAFSGWSQMGIAMHSIWGGFAALFTLGYTLQYFGIPLGLTTFLMSPLALVALFWIVEWWTGRPSE